MRGLIPPPQAEEGIGRAAGEHDAQARGRATRGSLSREAGEGWGGGE
jgi:hypothetical protein